MLTAVDLNARCESGCHPPRLDSSIYEDNSRSQKSIPTPLSPLKYGATAVPFEKNVFMCPKVFELKENMQIRVKGLISLILPKTPHMRWGSHWIAVHVSILSTNALPFLNGTILMWSRLLHAINRSRCYRFAVRINMKLCQVRAMAEWHTQQRLDGKCILFFQFRVWRCSEEYEMRGQNDSPGLLPRKVYVPLLRECEDLTLHG